MEDNHLGAGIDLYVVDNTSDTIKQVIKNYNDLINATDEVIRSTDNQTEALGNSKDAFVELYTAMESAQSLRQMGNVLVDVGKKGVDAFYGLGQTVANTGMEFERYKAQLGTLFKETPLTGFDKTQNELLRITKLAKQTPFEADQLVRASIGFRAIGIDPFGMFKDREGLERELILFAGDLAGAMGKSVGDAQWSIKEAAANQWRSMMMRFETGKRQVEQHIGRTLSTDMTDEGIQDRLEGIVQYISDKFGGGMEALAMTAEGLYSNVMDSWQLFRKDVADKGFYDDVKATLADVLNAFDSGFETGRLEGLAEMLSQFFSSWWKYVDLGVNALIRLVEAFSDLSSTYPHISRFILNVVALSSVLTIATGLVFNFGGSILQTVLAFSLMKLQLGNGLTAIGQFMVSLRSLSFFMLKAVAVSGLMYTAWKFNFFGIQDVVAKWKNNITSAYEELQKLHQLDATQGYGYAKMFRDLSPIAKFIERVQLASSALIEVFSGNFVMSSNTYQKLLQTGMLDFITNITVIAFGLAGIVGGVKDTLDVFANVLLFLGGVISWLIGTWIDFASIFVPSLSDVASLDFSSLSILGNILGLLIARFIVLKIVGGFTFMFSALQKLLPVVEAGIVLLRGLATGIFTVTLANLPLTLAILGVIAVLGILWYNWDSISNFMSEKWRGLVSWADRFTKSVDNAITKIQEFFGLEPKSFSENAAYAKDFLELDQYARGGFINRPQIALIGEAGPEAIIPLDGSPRAYDLWSQVGANQGFANNMNNVIDFQSERQRRGLDTSTPKAEVYVNTSSDRRSTGISVDKVEIQVVLPNVSDVAQLDKSKLRQIAKTVLDELESLKVKEEMRNYIDQAG